MSVGNSIGSASWDSFCGGKYIAVHTPKNSHGTLRSLVKVAHFAADASAQEDASLTKPPELLNWMSLQLAKAHHVPRAALHFPARCPAFTLPRIFVMDFRIWAAVLLISPACLFMSAARLRVSFPPVLTLLRLGFCFCTFLCVPEHG
jgi:hypothetical protein